MHAVHSSYSPKHLICLSRLLLDGPSIYVCYYLRGSFSSMCCLVATHSYFLLFVIYLMLNVPISICPSILSPLSFSSCLCFLAEFLHPVKPWPPLPESPYGPTAGLFSLSLCISAYVCVHTCSVLYRCFLVVSSHRSGHVCPCL